MYKRIKSTMDFSFALILCVFLVGPMLLIGLAVFLEGRPIIFKQKRSGKDGRDFVIYKFRTMINKATADENEAYVSNLGKFLRRFGLDELPQIFNVLKGDMSFIGPRPLLTQYLPLYTKEEKNRFEVRPGLSGLAQVSGGNSLTWRQRLEKDIQYVDNISLGLDLKIFFKTLLLPIKRLKSSEKEFLPSAPFEGND